MSTEKTYQFSPHAEARFKELETKFPQRSSLVIWALHLVQEDVGYIPRDAVDYVAQRVGVAPSWVAGVVSFYSMFHEEPIGKYNLNICYNASCYLMGSDKLEECVTRKLGIKPGETTPDGLFTYTRQAECLAACGKAPAIQVNEEYYEDLTPEKLEALIDELKKKG